MCFCIYLRTNSDLCHLQHKLIGFYNRGGKCLQRGTNWVFKYSGLRFVFKRTMQIKHFIIHNYAAKIAVNTVIFSGMNLCTYCTF